MPSKPFLPCRTIMCGALVRGGGWCDKHADQRSGWERSHNGRTAAQRGYGREWRKLRTAVMQRDRQLCQAHLTGGRYIQARAVDHITPKAQGGTDDMSNLQSLCNECHAVKTASEAANARRSVGRGG